MAEVPTILPFSELADKKEDILKLCCEKNEPVYLTDEGRGDVVLMSRKLYEKLVSEAAKSADVLKQDDKKNSGIKEEKPDEGIKKLPLEDVMYILKQQIKKEKFVK